MHGARIVSGKILSVTTDPGESIENVTFARVRNVFENSLFATVSGSAETWRIGRFEDTGAAT